LIMRTLRNRFRHFDWWLLTSLLILMIFSVVAVYSASTIKIGDEYHTNNNYLKQILWVVLSLFCIALILMTPYQVIDVLIIPAYVISILSLLIVFSMPQIKGATRWIVLGPLQLQPSEFAKVTTILILSKSLAKPHLTEFQILVRTILLGIPPIVLIAMQPDLGTTIVFWALITAILVFSDLPKFYIVMMISPFLALIASFSIILFIVYILVLVVVLFKFNLSLITIGFVTVINGFIFLMVPMLWSNLKVYQQNRILTFLDPTRDPMGAGYQAIQSRIAIGSGMLQGKGFLEGTQKNLNFLPERHTDFIFSVIAEEFGFLGAMLVIAVVLFFLYRLVRCLRVVSINEQRLAIVGIVALFTTQLAINMAINLGIFPTTGLPLPFISYGGSSILTNSIAVAIVMKYLTEKSLMI
jgi:rod shape determining protein RodA